MMSYKDLSDFLSKHNSSKNEIKSTPSHTRIADKTLQIYGGAYNIPAEELDNFFVYYYDHVFIKKRMEYLTEKQLGKGGPLLVDFDFRYSHDVDTRQHTKGHIQDMVLLYLEELKGFFLFTENVEFSVFILEKPKVNRLADESKTKDGIHMIIGIQMDSIMQMMLRDKMLKKLPEIWDDLPFINDWPSILDEGISKGKTNWQMFGSRKPGNEAYQLTQHFVIKYDKNDGEFMMDERRVLDFDMSKNIFKLSAQYPNHPTFEMNPKIADEYNKLANGSGSGAGSRPKIKAKVRLLCEDDEDDANEIPLSSITNKEILSKAMDKILGSLAATEFYIKETHEYTQILPEKYYEPGSHMLNRQVAFALKHTDDRLFLSWVMLRSKASDFDFATISELHHVWKKHIDNNKTSGVTRRSIMYWAKQDSYEAFVQVKDNTVDRYIEDTILSPTDYDFGMVLYYMFKDRYVCASLSSKPLWYTFINHRWEEDMGESLRLYISRDMHSVYQKKLDTYTEDLKRSLENQDQDKSDSLKKKIKYVSEMQMRLKRTSDKNNIMKEAAAIFYDKFFTRNMDANKYLLCFTNGVIDFKNKCFRDGYPQDYITKTTGVAYNPVIDASQSAIITAFMSQLFPNKDLNKYMWDHLASCLIGTNKNQTFNIYRGSGSNGKSMLVDLMSHALGDYYGQVPITLVTEKRNCIGGTSSEVIQLKGIRYAVMQEPSKEMRMNEGVMKELTGGDKIQARALYSASETFSPQFKLCVCTNSLFEIASNDDGTWRRIRICDFMSKFVDKIDSSNEDIQYQFLKDKELEHKIVEWAPHFVSMLVERAFITDGHVEDCDIVLASSNKYRQGQDHIAAFVSETLIQTGDPADKIGKSGLAQAFKLWFQESQGLRKTPKGAELYEYMEKRFGKCKSAKWSGLKFIEPEKSDEFEAN